MSAGRRATGRTWPAARRQNSRGRIIAASAARKPPDVTLVVHHRDERGVAGRRALDQTNLTARCRGCHQLEHYAGHRCAAKTTGPLPPFRPTRLSTQLISTLQDYCIFRASGSEQYSAALLFGYRVSVAAE
jgi:hypothetical protein